MATADTLVQEAQDSYNDAKTRADNAINRTEQALSDASNAVSGLYVNYGSGIINPDDVTPATIPVPDVPMVDRSSEIQDAFDHAFGAFNDALKPQILGYLDEFFPDIAEAVRTGSDQWIVDTIQNGRYVPVDVENSIWNRERDREVQDAQRAEQSLVNATASRGFSMPTGALAASIAANQQELAKKMNTIGRDIAIKDFDIANENTKFAIQQAVSLRASFVGALADFIRLATVQPNQAVDYAKLMLSAKTGIYDTAVRLYSAQVSAEEMRTGVLQRNRSLDLQGSAQWLDAARSSMQDRIGVARTKADTAMSAATALSQIAAASLATRNTMISASAGV